MPVLLRVGAALSVVCTSSVGFAGIFNDDQVAKYDPSFCMAMSTPNIMQNAVCRMLYAECCDNACFSQ